MNIHAKQLSSLEKVRADHPLNFVEINNKSALAGERFSYQISIVSEEPVFARVSVHSPLSDSIRLYQVRDAYADAPVTETALPCEDYITLEAGFIPDILVPLPETDHQIYLQNRPTTLWIRIDIPSDQKPDTYPVDVCLDILDTLGNITDTQTTTLTLTVISAVMPKQKLLYTRWFYADCIAEAHHVEIFSEAHWKLIDKYLAAAADIGINMILIPTHTPPLDTAVGTQRPCVQLIDIEKKGETYIFGFDRFKRFVDMCKKHGIEYFEIAHMFSQWGAKFAPNIMVTENGRTDYMFGWHVEADSDKYIHFLKQYIAAISTELQKEGISENTYFHISDEPSPDHIDTYKAASDIIRPLIGNSKTFDALSNYIFCEKGLVECPVTSVSHIHEFLEHALPNQWVYYCCNPQQTYTNCFLVSPSYRTRILGFLLYKYNIQGFLHWGFNFYNAPLSRYPINPYLTTSADKAFPSGDPFIVYPSADGVYNSIRGEMTYDAIQDMNICFVLEKQLGREGVIEMIDRAAGRDLRFDDYPKGNAFLENLREEMLQKLHAHSLK